MVVRRRQLMMLTHGRVIPKWDEVLSQPQLKAPILCGIFLRRVLILNHQRYCNTLPTSKWMTYVMLSMSISVPSRAVHTMCGVFI